MDAKTIVKMNSAAGRAGDGLDVLGGLLRDAGRSGLAARAEGLREKLHDLAALVGAMAQGAFVDPDQPGAPQVGDLVVPLWPSQGFQHLEKPGRLLTYRHEQWQVDDPRDGHPFVAPAVREPTPEELAAYQLSGGVP